MLHNHPPIYRACMFHHQACHQPCQRLPRVIGGLYQSGFCVVVILRGIGQPPNPSCSEANAASTRDAESDLLNDPQSISRTSPARAFRSTRPTCAASTRRQGVHAARSNMHIGTSRSRFDRRPVRLHRNTTSPDLSIASWIQTDRPNQGHHR